MTPTLGIVTVAYNSSATLGAYLTSVRRDALGASAEIIVVDNLSDDADAARSIVEGHGGRWLSALTNGGYGAGINAGVAALSLCDYVAITNPDVVVSGDALATLVAHASADVSVGAIGPRILNEDGTVYPSARAQPSLRVGIGHALLGTAVPGNRWSRRYHEDYAADAIREAGWLSGAFLVVRRDVFEHIGGFDESYFMYFEDVDLGARIAQAGFANIYDPSAQVVHAGAQSTSTHASAMVREHHASAYRFLARKYPGLLLAPVRWALFIGLRVRSWWITR